MTTQAERKSALVIMAHPDDAEFSVAGTVALWVRDGWDVRYAVCANGASGGPDDATEITAEAREDIIKTRQQEQRAAALIVGVQDVLFLGYPDGQVQASQDLQRELVSLLRTYRPSRVVCMSPDRNWNPSLILPRYHPDHLASGQAAMAALYPAAQSPWFFPDLLRAGLKPHKVHEIYVVLAPVINFAVDISETIDLKMQAVRAHTSQLRDPNRVEQMLRGFATEEGRPFGLDCAEVFHRIVNE